MLKLTVKIAAIGREGGETIFKGFITAMIQLITFGDIRFFLNTLKRRIIDPITADDNSHFLHQHRITGRERNHHIPAVIGAG